MDIRYVKGCDCYNTILKIPVGKDTLKLYPYIDTGATNTTVSFDILTNGRLSSRLIEQLNALAQKLNIRPGYLRGATVSKENEKRAYTYPACFKNVIVGGHYMEKFHVNIMIDGAENMCVIGNDFLNMCNYQHKAGEKQLMLESPNMEKYYKSFGTESVLSSEQLNVLLANTEEISSFSVF